MEAVPSGYGRNGGNVLAKDLKKTTYTAQQNLVLYLHDLIYLLAVIILIFTLVFRIVIVSGPSMYDTLLNGDYLLLLSNTFYRNPEQGDIVVISKKSYDNGTPIVKRVIATEGQTVDIDFETGVVYVDGIELDEPYVQTPTNLQEGTRFPLTVEKGCVFLMGDNRNESKDSRSPEIGQVDTREILGKAIFLFLPGNHWNTESRDFGRIGFLSRAE